MFFCKKKKKEEQSELDLNDMLNLDRFWLSQELEFQHQNEKVRFRANEAKPLELGNIIHSLFDIRKEEVSLLTVNNGSILTNIEEQDEIWNYNLLSEYIKLLESAHRDRYTVILSLFYRGYEQKKMDKDKSIIKNNACLIIHLDNASGRRDKVVYVQTTICQPPIQLVTGITGRNPKALSFLIGYDYRPESEITKEFYDVFDSAKNKALNGETNELTLIEQDLLKLYIGSWSIADSYYGGKQAMQDDRFWDAIVYFERAFQELQNRLWEEGLNDEESEMYEKISFYIGFCYYELGLYEKAYKYLEFPYSRNNDNYDYFSEFVNCLERLRDTTAFHLIQDRIKEIHEKDDINEENRKFLWFCYRREAYMLIELKEYERAKSYLEQMLKIDPNNEFAKEELAYIDEISKQ